VLHMKNVISYYMVYFSFIFCLNQHTNSIDDFFLKKKNLWIEMFFSELDWKNGYKNAKSI